MSKFVATLPALYKDNSLHKEILRKQQISEKYKKLEKQLKTAESSRKKISEIVRIEDNKEQLIIKINQEIANKNDLFRKMNKAASTIQKNTKQWKILKKTKEKFLFDLENKIHEDLQSLESSLYYIFWNLGNAAIDASNRIKNAYKRSKIREKLERLRKTYKIVKKNTKTMSRIFIRKTMRVFACRAKLAQLQILKEERLRNEKLLIIRKRVSLLSIKIFWKSNKFSYRKFMFKCKKFKRIQQRSKIARFLSAEIGKESNFTSYITTPKNELLNSEFVNDQETIRMAALKLFKEQQERLKASMISYNVKKFKNKNISPLNLQTVDESYNRIVLVRKRIHKTIDYSNVSTKHSEKNIRSSNKCIRYSHQSIGSLSTRPTSNRGPVFRF